LLIAREEKWAALGQLEFAAQSGSSSVEKQPSLAIILPVLFLLIFFYICFSGILFHVREISQRWTCTSTPPSNLHLLMTFFFTAKQQAALSPTDWLFCLK